MKRVLALMLAVVLVLSLGITAFAADNGSITIQNATVGQTYNLYKIFDATYATDIVDGKEVTRVDEDGNPVITYTIDPVNNQFFNAMFGENGTAADFFEYHEDTNVVTRAGGTNEGLFAYLAELLENANPDETAANVESTVVNFTGLATGYYVILREQADHTKPANTVTITATAPHADVIDKNQLPGGDISKEMKDGQVKNENGDLVDNWVESNTASVGDTIDWRITFTATNYDGDKKVEYYLITDTLSAEWANIDVDTDNIKVYVGGEPITDWEFTENEDATFEIKIPWTNVDEGKFVDFKYASTAKVEVTFSGVVNGTAPSDDATVRKNNAKVNWDTEDGDDIPDIPENDTPGDETETYTFNMGFTKVDGTNGNGLTGAQFQLYSDAECTNEVKVAKVQGVDGKYIVNPNGNDVIESPEDGEIIIEGLAAGTYYLKEIEAPAGYNKLDGVTTITVGSDDMDNQTFDDYTVHNDETNIANFTGVVMPETGGKGTMMLLTFGTMVAVAFAVLMITQKKMSIYND